MKKIFLMCFIIIFCLTSCSNNKNLQFSSEHKNNSVENFSTDNDIINMPAEDFLNSFDENFGKFDNEFNKIIKNNPIDKIMLSEYDNNIISTTKEMLDFTDKYINIWKNEMKIVYENLQKILKDDSLEILIDSQKSWNKYIKNELDLLYHMYINSTGTGSIISLALTYKEIYFIRSRTFELAHYYYTINGNYMFTVVD